MGLIEIWSYDLISPLSFQNVWWLFFFQGGYLSLPFIVIDHRWVYRPAVGKMSADWPRNSMKLDLLVVSKMWAKCVPSVHPKKQNMVRFSGQMAGQAGCTHGICNTISWEYTLGCKTGHTKSPIQTSMCRQSSCDQNGVVLLTCLTIQGH